MASFSLNSAPIEKYRITSFAGGLNTQTSNGLLEDHESPDLLNVVFDPQGTVYKRPGLTPNLAFPYKENVGVAQIIRHQWLNGDDTYYVFFVDGTVQFLETINGVKAIKTLSILDKDAAAVNHKAGTSVNGEVIKYSHFNFMNTSNPDDVKNALYFGNHIDGWFKIDKTDYTKATFVSTIPKCKYALYRAEYGRVFYAHEENDKDTLFVSRYLNPEDCGIFIRPDTEDVYETVGGEYDFPTEERGITGLAVYLDKLIIFKKDSLYSLEGGYYTPDLYPKRISVATGCVSSESIAVGHNSLFYVGHDGVYILQTPYQNYVISEPVSKKITPVFNYSKTMNSVGVYHKSKYYLSLDNETYVYNETLQAWSKWTITFTDAVFDETMDKMLFSSETGYIYHLEDKKLKDELLPGFFTGIHARYTTAFFSFKIPEITKRYKWLKVFFRPNDRPNSVIKVKVSIDGFVQDKEVSIEYNNLVWEEDNLDSVDNNWGENWGDKRDQVSKLLRFGGTGDFISFSFENDQIDEDMQIHSMIVGYKTKSKVR